MFIGNPANGDKLQPEYPWATEVSIAHNKPIELKLRNDNRRIVESGVRLIIGTLGAEYLEPKGIKT